MLIEQFYEYIYYLFITCLIFFLFFFLITIFGSIFFDIFSKKIIKNTEKIPLIERIFLSFGIGTSIFMSLSFTILMFNFFNFFIVYLPLIIIDAVYISYLITPKLRSPNYLKLAYSAVIIKIKKNNKLIISICFTLTILVILQINMQWQLITLNKGLMFRDPYANVKKIYYIIDYDTYFLDGEYFYPPGYAIFCSGALLITEDFINIFYFLKFGAIPLLTLYFLLIFYLSYRIFKKLFIAFSCSILFLSFYFYIYMMNAFLSSTVAIFFVGCSILIFIQKKKFLSLLGFFLPLIFFINPGTLFSYMIIIFTYIIYFFCIDLKNYKENFIIIGGIAIIAFLLVIPYLFYIHLYDYNFFDILKFYWDYFFIGDTITSTLPKQGEALKVQRDIKILFEGTFSLSSYLVTNLLFAIFGGLGFLFKPSKNKVFLFKDLLIICKVSLIIIGVLNVMVYFFLYTLSSSYFLQIYFDRIYRAYSAFLILLCGFGIKQVRKILKRIIFYFTRNEIFIITHLKNKKILNKSLIFEKIFISLLIISTVNNQISQVEEVGYNWTNCHFDNYSIEAYLFLRTRVSNDSIVLTENFTDSEINLLLYETEIVISPSNIKESFTEFRYFINKMKIDYLILNKTAYNENILIRINKLDNYELIFENKIFYIYEVKLR